MGKYSRGGFRSVKGWLEPISAQVITSIATDQRNRGLGGATGEIGVHHGKLLLLLHDSTISNERTIAIDIFGDQHLNTDGSGRGDKERFLKNLQRWSDRPEAVEVLQSSSLDVEPDDIISRVGRLRIASVDGGHTAECTEHDLRLIQGASHDYAVIILDDVFNARWPDVVVGLSRYMADESTTFRPFAISPNKLYLAKPEYHTQYIDGLRNNCPRLYEVDQIMFNHRVAIYGVETLRKPIKVGLRNYIRTMPFFPALKYIKDRIF